MKVVGENDEGIDLQRSAVDSHAGWMLSISLV